MVTMLAIATVPIAASTAMGIGAIMSITGSVIACTSIPLIAGVKKGNVPLGIIGALVTLPVASLLCFASLAVLPDSSILSCIAGGFGGSLVAFGFAAVISIVPVPSRALLSQSEIERESQRLRGE